MPCKRSSQLSYIPETFLGQHCSNSVAIYQSAIISAMPKFNPKKMGKDVLCRILERQVGQLRERHKFTLIVVVGSVGKTSTKLTIAKTLAASQTVIFQEGNYNDRLTVPLVLFSHELPGLFNIFAWLKIILANRRIIKDRFPYTYAVLELGTDKRGEIAQFAYLKPDIAVVTAITPEHMESFKTLKAVADEELAVFDYSEQVLINRDDIAAEFLSGRNYKSFSLEGSADYRAINIESDGLSGGTFALQHGGKNLLEAKTDFVGKQGVKIALAAAVVTEMAGLQLADIAKGLKQVKPFAGRMQILQGIKNSSLIDDSYNASPAAVMAGLDVLYATPAKQRIAILGSMNELGDYSAKAHRAVGSYCNPKKLDLVVTIGREAERYLAPAAAETGCQVKSFVSPYEAGNFVAGQVSEQTLVLAEGSQNGVFAEEALKALLKNKDDATKLVRQSPYWLAIKRRQFPH
jgi:UDP-N-acetylmuramoyl-tripeptide--D-alanyl-D-alanine ligase